ncbi:YdbH domain-containing protein [Marinobacter sp. F3R11]|uniref:YdbH domain-containing protein n=1 Tax=Marinobacter sp. F3R11 TaxID=2267231 RepID=UPI000DEA70B5|nr:YdbH domain-containing protein [Marinobacter sp. F3R11]RBW49961.1 hypothetical protein DS878_06495 [Marinobacter sp. F3R11]
MRIAWKPLGWSVFVFVAVAAVAGALLLSQFWNETLQHNGIETLDWQGLELSFTGVSVSELTLTQSVPSRDAELYGRDLILGWRPPGSGEGWLPQLTRLEAGYLGLDLYTKQLEPSDPEPEQQAQWPPELPDWLPSVIDIQQFSVTLPCATDRCSLAGNLSLSSSETDFSSDRPTGAQLPLKANLELEHEGDQVDVLATLEGSLNRSSAVSVRLEMSYPAAWLNKVPELMRPDSLTLSVRPGDAIEPDFLESAFAQTGAEQVLLPLNLEVTSRGGANITLSSHLAVSTSAPWIAQLGQTQLTAALPELESAGWLLTKPQVQMAFTGWLDSSAAALKFGEATILEVDKAEPLPGAAAAADEISLMNFSADLAGATLEAGYRLEQGELEIFSLSGALGLAAKQIDHPQLQPQSWQFNGKVNSNLIRTDIAGLLRAGTGTTVNLDVKAPYAGSLHLAGNMRVSGEQEAEALSQIFTAWPPLLTVSGGTVSANAVYEQPQKAAMQLVGKLMFADWSGTYDRTAWSRMNGEAEFSFDNDRIRVSMPELTIEEVNSGLPVGPVLLAGHYGAPRAELSAGQLTLEQLNTDALGGVVRIQPGSWDLANAPVTIPVELDQLSLAQLLQLYPTEGLSGTGILSGTVPVLFDPAKGVRVEQGRIDALTPGGRLQLPAERLQALASQNDTMKLVAQALEDFRYSVLESGIDYDESGTLMLDLHLKGSSLEVGEGQPVVLNINLEENIPALLTSLQLSGRVSDAVAERVRKLMQEREHN